MRADVRITELQLVQATTALSERMVRAIAACEENEVWRMLDLRAYVVSVSDPNPDKVHAVLASLADIGVVVG